MIQKMIGFVTRVGPGMPVLVEKAANGPGELMRHGCFENVVTCLGGFAAIPVAQGISDLGVRNLLM